MSLRPRTIRRLGVILTAVVLVAGILAGLYLHNESVRAAKLAEDRAAGIAAFKANDYITALGRLKSYVWRVPGDAEALYAYGASRFRVEEPDQRNIAEGKNALLMVLQADPKHVAARHTLLELYTRAQYTAEAIALADNLLRENPADAEAINAKVLALDHLHRFKEALELSEKLNELNPTDVQQQIITLDLMRKLGRTPAEMVERTQKQQQAHADDPRYELLLGMALRHAGKIEQAKSWFTRAAGHPVPDAVFAAQLVNQLDTLRLASQADRFLDRASQTGDPRLTRLVAQRLWHGSRPQEIIARLDKLDPRNPGSDSVLLAYRAMALYALDRPDEARAIVEALARRRDDAQAAAWSTALEARYNLATTSPRSAVIQLQDAIRRANDNLPICFMLGEVYLLLGENELAVGTWNRCAEVAANWPMPLVQISRVLAGDGRFPEAVSVARRAVKAVPDNASVAANLAAIRFQQLEQAPDDEAARELLEYVQKVQAAFPGEPQSLPAFVALSARHSGREAALAALKAVLKEPKRYDQATLLRLAGVSRTEKLGLEDELLGAAGNAGDTPRVAMARAQELAASGKPDEGLALLEARAKTATTQPVQWQLAIAQYREIAHDPGAAVAWMALGDANPKDLAVQSAILRSAISARSDRGFIARTIDRLRDMTGAESLTWKIERARWLISSDNRDKDSADAVNTLNEVVRVAPELVEPRALLALAYENVGNLPAATKEMQGAADRDPSAARLALDAARLLQMQAKYDEARTYLDRAAAIKGIAPQLRLRVATLYAHQGEYALAGKCLENAGDTLGAEAELLRAELYVRQDRPNDAAAVYDKLLGRKPVNLAVLQSAAAFHASRNQREQANQIINRVAELSLPPGTADIAIASFNERFGSTEIAARHYAAATQTAPSQQESWRNLIAAQLRFKRTAEAQKSAAQALQAFPGDASITALRCVADAVAASADTAFDLRQLADFLSSSAESAAVKDILAALDSSRTQKLTPEQTLSNLRPLVEGYPRIAQLQLALVQWCVRLNHLEEANRIAARAMDQFPTSPDAARAAAMVYRLSGQWELVASAAQQWRRRSHENPQEADLALADAKLHLNDAAGAARVLEPYAARAAADPQVNAALLNACARAFAAAGKDADARKLLQPLLPRDPAWRSTWMQIAASELSTLDAARAWLEEVAPLIHNDATQEQFELVSAWYKLAVRFHQPQSFAVAARRLDGLMSRPDATAPMIALRALIAEEMNDYQTAEAHYRRSLQLDQKQTGPLNNLAYLLLQHGGNLDEARSLAERAIVISPNAPEFYDTLARIHLRGKQYPAAMENFEKALKLDPNSLAALIGMATTLNATGNKPLAATKLSQIDNLLKARPALSPALREELDSLRTTIKVSL